MHSFVAPHRSTAWDHRSIGSSPLRMCGAVVGVVLIVITFAAAAIMSPSHSSAERQSSHRDSISRVQM
jgi:hypothetical protein